MNKNYVSEELKNCLDYLVRLEGKEWILKKHAIKKYQNKTGWTTESYKVLNDLNLNELAKLLYEGYKLEETKEEKLLRYYNAAKELDEDYDKGFMKGIDKVLELYKIKVDGIN